MNVLTPQAVAAEGYYIPQVDGNLANPFDYAHYHQYADGIAQGATEHGVALFAREVPLGGPELDMPQLTAIVPFGEWSKLGRYKNRFENADTELRAAFSSLKSTVSEWSGYRFQALNPHPQHVRASISESTHGWMLGVNEQYTSISRRPMGIMASRTIVGVGAILGEGLMLPINRDRAAKMQTVAHNVAYILNEVLVTKIKE
jgi:hypothetical protein